MAIDFRTLTTGTVVHYVLDEGPNKGISRPGIIVDDSDRAGLDQGIVNLNVMVRGADGFHYLVVERFAVRYNGTAAEPGSWHEMAG